MHFVLGLIAALSWAALQPARAQGSAPAPKRAESPARVQQNTEAAKPTVTPTEKEAAEARARNEARQKVWDERMKRTMRSICSGVQGC